MPSETMQEPITLADDAAAVVRALHDEQVMVCLMPGFADRVQVNRIADGAPIAVVGLARTREGGLREYSYRFWARMLRADGDGRDTLRADTAGDLARLVCR